MVQQRMGVVMASEDELALWLGRELSVAQGNATQEILFTDIAEQVEQGTPFADAVADVTRHDARAGDFGIEVVGSLVAMALLDGLKVFWASYLKQLEEKAGKSLADMTLDFIKSRFRADVNGAASPAIEADVSKAVAASGTKLGIGPADMQPTLSAVRTALSGSL